MTREITDLIDHAVRDWETSGDAMRWAPEPPAATRRTRHAPIHNGGLYCLFVGGPWHGRRHNVLHDGRLPEAYRVAACDPPLWRIMNDACDEIVSSSPIRVVTYSLRWTAVLGEHHWPLYCTPEATNADITRAVIEAFRVTTVRSRA